MRGKKTQKPNFSFVGNYYFIRVTPLSEEVLKTFASPLQMFLPTCIDNGHILLILSQNTGMQSLFGLMDDLTATCYRQKDKFLFLYVIQPQMKLYACS